MARQFNRRTLLALPLLLTACAPHVEILPSETLVIDVPQSTRSAFFQAIRDFAKAKGYQLEEESYVHEAGTTWAFILHGWRSQIQILNVRADREYSPTDFRVNFYASRFVQAWGLSDEAFDNLVADFTEAMNRIDGLSTASEYIEPR